MKSKAVPRHVNPQWEWTGLPLDLSALAVVHYSPDRRAWLSKVASAAYSGSRLGPPPLSITSGCMITIVPPPFQMGNETPESTAFQAGCQWANSNIALLFIGSFAPCCNGIFLLLTYILSH